MAIETLRPTAYSNPATVGNDFWGTPANAYDGNSSTSAQGSDSTTGTGLDGSSSAASDVIFRAWQGPTYQSYYSALNLKVTYSVSVSKVLHNGAEGNPSWELQYSTNGGTSWTDIASGTGNVSQTTATIALSTGVTFSNLQVRAALVAEGEGGDLATWTVSVTLPVFEVWTEGTYTPPPPPATTGLTAIAGDGQVQLNWNAVSGAASYNVRRQFGIGWPVVGTPTGTTFTDTGRSNGTTYTYEVSAVDSYGQEGAEAGPVSATPTAPPGTGGGCAVLIGF